MRFPNFALLILVAIALNACAAKPPSSEPLLTVAPATSPTVGRTELKSNDNFYSGTWVVNQDNPTSKITLASFATPQVFALESDISFDDISNSTATIITGNTMSWLVGLVEGGTLFVEAKSITIQLSKGDRMSGRWSIVRKPLVPAIVGTLDRLGAIDHGAIDFQTSQEFVVGLINYKANAGYGNFTFTLAIDGKPIKDSTGADLYYAAGNTVYGSGKSVVLRQGYTVTSGTSLPPPGPLVSEFTGEIKIRAVP